jgi:hypothetical protein
VDAWLPQIGAAFLRTRRGIRVAPPEVDDMTDSCVGITRCRRSFAEGMGWESFKYFPLDFGGANHSIPWLRVRNHPFIFETAH